MKDLGHYKGSNVYTGTHNVNFANLYILVTNKNCYFFTIHASQWAIIMLCLSFVSVYLSIFLGYKFELLKLGT